MSSYFKPEEVEGLSDLLVEKLNEARWHAGIPFIINEGVASGGDHVSNTSHQRGLAVDLKCLNSYTRNRIVRSLISVGFRRIGVYDKHVHVDIDESLPQDVIWWGISS